MERHEFKVFCITNVILFILSYLISYVIASLMADSFWIPISHFAFPSFFTIWGFTPLSFYGTIVIFILYFILFCAGCFFNESETVISIIFTALTLFCVIGTIALSEVTDPFIYFLSLRNLWIIGISGIVNLFTGLGTQGG